MDSNSMRFLLSLLICTTFGLVSFSQEDTTLVPTNELWTGLSVKYKLNKKLTFTGQQQIRISDNLDAIRSNFFSLSAKYRFNKYFSTKAQYRYTIRNGERNTNRYSIDGNLKWKIKPANLELSYRARFQHAVVVFTGEPATHLRNKAQIQYKLSKKFKPFFSYEKFYKFREHQGSEFRTNRYTLGFNTTLTPQIDATVFYRRDSAINTKLPNRENILAFLLTYKI